MKACCVVLLMAGMFLTAAVHGGDKDKPKSDGTWIVVTMEQDGVKLPDEAVKKLALKLVITGNKYKVFLADKLAEQGTSKVDTTKKPVTVDIDASEGPNKGKTIKAIVDIQGDTMKVCYNLKGTERPKEFTTQKGSGHALITYEREKK